MRADALGSAGLRTIGSPWNPLGSAAAWSVAFAGWLLRGNGVPPAATPLELYRYFEGRGRVGPDPRDGALVFYTAGPAETVYHVGFVESVRAGVISTVEGDVPGDLPAEQTFVRRYGRPWDASVVYGYPDYAGDA